MVVHNISSKTDFDKAIKDHPAVILDAFATWCGPCKAIAPVLAKLSNHEDNERLHFIKIDVDEVPDLSQELGIRAMPTFFIFKHGEKVKEVVGANPPALTGAIAELAKEFPSLKPTEKEADQPTEGEAAKQ